jgi:hypothetical protein
MADAWLSYADIAKALGTSPEAARQKAIRGRWRRQRGNDGRALVLADLEAEQARTRPDDGRTKRPDDARTVAALDAHIAGLMRVFETPVDTYGRFFVLTHDDAGIGAADEGATVNRISYSYVWQSHRSLLLLDFGCVFR